MPTQPTMTPKNKIKTQFINPPIPFRDCDWIAWMDGANVGGGAIGYGQTEQMAIERLKLACFDDSTFKPFTAAELGNARSMREALLEYVEVGHIVDINGNVLVNRIGVHVFGKGVWNAMLKELQNTVEDK